ncbi:MAG: tyrosine-type recombinase/integrase [Pseudomonadota bacterium]
MPLKVIDRDGWLHIHGSMEGRRIRKSVGLRNTKENRKLADKQRAGIEGEILSGGLMSKDVHLSRAKVVDALRAYEAHKIYNLKRQTGDRAVIKMWIAEIGDEKTVDLSPKYFLAWTSEKRADGLKDSTIRQYLKVLQRALNWAEDNGYCLLPDKFKIPKPPSGAPRTRFLEDWEVRDLKACASPWFRDVLTFLFGTGARTIEMLRLKWEHVRWREGEPDEVLLHNMKGRERTERWRSVPLPPDVAGVLKRLHEAQGKPREGFVFWNAAGNRPLHDCERQAVYEAWESAATNACVYDCHPHDSRRTYASKLLDEDVDIAIIAELIGDSDMSIVAGYARVRGSNKRSVVRSKLQYDRA